MLPTAKSKRHHEDYDDLAQTLYFPKIETSLYSKNSGLKEQIAANTAMGGANLVLSDEVRLSNLVIGKTYTIEGTLYDASTSLPLNIGGRTFTQSTTFGTKIISCIYIHQNTTNGVLLTYYKISVINSITYIGLRQIEPTAKSK